MQKAAHQLISDCSPAEGTVALPLILRDVGLSRRQLCNPSYTNFLGASNGVPCRLLDNSGTRAIHLLQCSVALAQACSSIVALRLCKTKRPKQALAPQRAHRRRSALTPSGGQVDV